MEWQPGVVAARVGDDDTVPRNGAGVGGAECPNANKNRAVDRLLSYSPMNPRSEPTSLRGWRSQAWSLVLFVALLRGLVPHAALAALLDDGRPQLAYCAPGKALPGAAAEALAAHGHCVCAPAGESLSPSAALGLPAMPAPVAVALSSSEVRPAEQNPPIRLARGPPSHS